MITEDEAIKKIRNTWYQKRIDPKKSILLIFILTVAVVLLVVYLQYGKDIPWKGVSIGLGMFVLIIVLGLIIRHKSTMSISKKTFLVTGIVMIVFAIVYVFVKSLDVQAYSSFVIGLIFLAVSYFVK